MGTHPIFESDFDCLTDRIGQIQNAVCPVNGPEQDLCYPIPLLREGPSRPGVEIGLRNKREVWRVKLAVAKVRKVARPLLTLEEKDPKRLFEGNALLRRLVRIGVLPEDQMKLDYVLGLKIENFLERRLQTQVFKLGLAKSIHHARVLIKQRHIRVRKQVVNVPSFIVRLDSQKHIDFSLKSPFGGGRPGRVKRKNAKKGSGGDDDEE